MSSLEKHFDSVEEVREWLATLDLHSGQRLTVIVTSENEAAAPDSPRPKVRFSDTALCGLWKDRDELQDVGRHVRELRKPRHPRVS